MLFNRLFGVKIYNTFLSFISSPSRFSGGMDDKTADSASQLFVLSADSLFSNQIS